MKMDAVCCMLTKDYVAYLQLCRQVSHDLLCDILLTAVGSRAEELELVKLLT